MAPPSRLMPSVPPQAFAFDDEPPSTRQVEDVLYPHRKALAALMHSEQLSSGDVAGALELVTEVASRILRVERASVGGLARTGARSMFQSFRANAAHPQEGRQSARRFVSELLRRSRRRAQHRRIRRAYQSPHERILQVVSRTQRYRRDARRPRLRARYDGGRGLPRARGWSRRWLHWEELVAGSIADFVALALEAADRNAAHQKLQHHQDVLPRSSPPAPQS